MAVLLRGTRIARCATAAVAFGVIVAAAAWSGHVDISDTFGVFFNDRLRDSLESFQSGQIAPRREVEQETLVALHLENKNLKQRLHERTRLTSELSKSLAAGLAFRRLLGAHPPVLLPVAVGTQNHVFLLDFFPTCDIDLFCAIVCSLQTQRCKFSTGRCRHAWLPPLSSRLRAHARLQDR